jgi:Hint domain
VTAYDKTITVNGTNDLNLFTDGGSSPINASALDSASVTFEPPDGTNVVGMDYPFAFIDHSNTSDPYQEYTNSYDIIDNRLLNYVNFQDYTAGGTLAGTNIRTPNGEVAVETLKTGDLILTTDGEAAPVRWVGVNTVSTESIDPLRVMPVRIRAGALADNVPVRDILVSPTHAMFIDGVLVQAGALVNGISIVREINMPAATFAYYHVELEEHCLILAEGAPTETFVDNVGRMAFDNWDEYLALYREGFRVKEMPWPRARSHRQVSMAIRGMMSGRAAGMSNPAG